jgi:hypothetical protein
MSTGVVRQMNNAKQTYETSKVDSRYSIGFGSEGLYGARVDSEHGKQTQALDNKDGFEELLPILETRRGFQESDSRDRVFAHLGLVGNVDLKADYGMSC